MIPDFERQIKSNPGALRELKFPEITVKGNERRRFSSEPLPVKYGEAVCGVTTTSILVKDASRGLGSEEHKRFVCDGSRYEFTIELAVDRTTLGFNFEVETRCA